MNSAADRFAENKGIPRVYITDLILNKTELDLELGRQFTLTSEITPDSSKDQKVTWVSDNPAVATIENGLVRTKSKGKALITATTEDGTYEKCVVNVYENVIHHEAVPPTCTENGTIEYWVSENKYYTDGALLNQTFDITDTATGHDWGDCEYTWDDEFNCTAMRTCKNDPSHVEIETVKAEKAIMLYPDCENSGINIYTAKFENSSFHEQTKEEAVPATGHKWSEPQYRWQGEDVPTECEAWRVCENDYEYQIETADVAYRILYEPTCDEEGMGEFYAVFKDPEFTEQVWPEIIPQKDHSYGEPTYTWSDDNKTCTAKRVCSNDNTHIETETADVISEITRKPTCEEKGKTTYTAVFTNAAFKTQAKTVENIAPKGHKWGVPVWSWTGTTEAKATFICENDSEHTVTVNAEITSAVTVEPTEDREGVRTYTARITTGGSEYSDNKTERIPKIEITVPTPDEPKPEPVLVEVGLLGDVTYDGTINSADALAILRASIKLETFDNDKNLLGDVNGDDTLDSADALDVLRYSVGLSTNENIGRLVTKLV